MYFCVSDHQYYVSQGSGAGGPQRSVEEGRRELTSEVPLDDETEK